MASSLLRSKSHYHVRSISFPSRLFHPLIHRFNDHLCRLRSLEATSTSLPSISNSLSGLEDLYDCVDDLLLLPHNRQALAQEGLKKLVDQALDRYLKLLDACAATKDIFSQTKDDVKELLSSLRRKRDGDKIGGFLTSRKKAKKAIQTLLKNLKSIRNKDMLLDSEEDQEALAVISMLKEVEAVTVVELGSLLSYAAGTKEQSKRSGWSLVSKVMHQKKAACQTEETALTEFQEVDAAVESIIAQKSCKFDEDLQKQMGKLELSIQGLEEVLERFIRRLIKTRVSLLNILNH